MKLKTKAKLVIATWINFHFKVVLLQIFFFLRFYLLTFARSPMVVHELQEQSDINPIS